MKKLLLLSVLGLAFLPQPTIACTIPVFRYALERWELDTFDVLIYHKGPLSAELQKEIKHWSDGPGGSSGSPRSGRRRRASTLTCRELSSRNSKPIAAR